MKLKMKLIPRTALLLMIGALFSACSSQTVPSALSIAQGFYEIEPVNFSLQKPGLPTLAYTSSRVRILYAFYPAQSHPETKPLFVFFNGGPGCSTCAGLFSFNTAPHTLDRTRTGGAYYKDNSYSFTRMGNVLYLDAPNTGFSYHWTENASDGNVRKSEFDAQNFNPFIDAAQMTRVLMRFLADHAAIRKNSVVIVGESYGGVRASIMMNMILFHHRYADGTRVYQDVRLAEEIRGHFRETDTAGGGDDVSPETAAAQFGTQILIEPVIAGQHQEDLAGQAFEKEGSVIFKIAAETRTTYTPCSTDDCDPLGNVYDFLDEKAKRDYYKYDAPAGYTMGLVDDAREALNLSDVLSAVFHRDIRSIGYLGPSYRENAYRYIQDRYQDGLSAAGSPVSPRLPGWAKTNLKRKAAAMQQMQAARAESDATLDRILGALNIWDDYVIGCNDDVLNAFYDNSALTAGYAELDPLAPSTGELFLQNLALVRTMVTDSALDLVIYAPVIPDALSQYPALVENVVRRDEADNGYIDVYYKPGSLADTATPAMRTIYFPRYALSGHMVSQAQPDKFYKDVQAWLGF